MVSSLAPRFAARLVRLIHGDPDPAGPGIKMQQLPSAFEGEYDGMKQSIPLGSEAHFPDAESIRALTAFSVALWVHPTAVGGRPYNRRCEFQWRGDACSRAGRVEPTKRDVAGLCTR
jgi:N,N-dimethylformamidase